MSKTGNMRVLTCVLEEFHKREENWRTVACKAMFRNTADVPENYSNTVVHAT